MSNPYAWYAVVIPFFYLAFLAAFRFCKKEGAAISMVFAFTLAYTLLCAAIDHQNVWWIRGEWWYNSIILFPMGLLFAKYEDRVLRFFRKGYIFWLLGFFAGIFLLFRLSENFNNTPWGGYYGEGAPMKIPRRLLSALFQWLVCAVYVAFCFLVMMKVRLGGRVLAWMGSATLDLYLMHGIFAELFGFSFMGEAGRSLYIRQLPLYIAAVLACTVPAVILFRFIRLRLTRFITRPFVERASVPSEDRPGGA